MNDRPPTAKEVGEWMAADALRHGDHMILHRQLGGGEFRPTQKALLTIIERQPETSQNPDGAVITYAGQKIAVVETPDEVQKMFNDWK